MTPSEMSDVLGRIADQVGNLTTDPREWGRGDVDASIEVWNRLDKIITDLTILRRDHAVVAATRIDDEHTAVTRDGIITVHRDTETTTVWDGAGVLDDLAQTVIDANGERIDAVPVDTLRKVIPACEPGKTSSKWRVRDLAQVSPGIVRARSKVTDGDTMIKRGGSFTRNRYRKPSTDTPETAGELVPQPVDRVDSVVYEDRGDDL